MLNGAKVVTSKFLQLRDKLNNAMMENERIDYNSPSVGVGINKTSCDIHALQKAFGELCVLLHELTVKDNASTEKGGVQE